MRVLFLPFVWLLLSVTGAVSAAPLPPMRGALAGEFRPPGGLVPALPWRITTSPGADGSQHYQVTVDIPDGRLQATVALASDHQAGAWQVDAAELNVGPWWRRVAGKLELDADAWQPAGRLEVTGQGTWRDGRPHGALRLAWEEADLSATTPALEVEGLRVKVELASGWGSGILAGEGELAVARAVVAGVEATEVMAPFAWRPEGVLAVGAARLRAFGGELEVAPFGWRPGDRHFLWAVRVTDIDVAPLVALVPEAVRQAEGRVSGRVLLQLTPERGFEPVGGSLVMSGSQPVRLRLAPQPGFLTGNVAPRIQLLPDRFGVLARHLLRPKNPIYPVLEAIELGREPLTAERFTIEFFPPDDPLGRTAQVSLVGRPVENRQVRRVTIGVNLSGPLADVVRAGLQGEVSMRLEP